MRCRDSIAGSVCEADFRLTPVVRHTLSASILILLLFFCQSCSSYRKLKALKSDAHELRLSLPEDELFVPDAYVYGSPSAQSDTLKVKDIHGNDVYIMKAVKDEETGEMVATEELQAAVVSARFRHVAERQGKVELNFRIEVPDQMQAPGWQLRLRPQMYILGDSLSLDELILTGEDYRRIQLRSYDRYDRYMSRIISDDSHFVDERMLRIFLQRNAIEPKTSLSRYGIGEQDALEHYTDWVALNLNERRKSKGPEMFSKYVKAPLLTESVRLDTLIRDNAGSFVYDYRYDVATRSGLRKIDVLISGAIYEQDRLLYIIPPSKPLTFYVSSVSSFVDARERYIRKIVSRNAESSAECRLVFGPGESQIREELGDNRSEINRIKAIVGGFLSSDEYDLDSVSVIASASPEGSEILNSRLSAIRAESSSRYFENYVESFKDSLQMSQGIHIRLGNNLDEEDVSPMERSSKDICFRSYSKGEDWNTLDELVLADTHLTARQKSSYCQIKADAASADRRESLLMQEDYYTYLREQLYPQLRKVRFDFLLSRKGMVKDTIHTTQLDTAYMRAVGLVQDREYVKALEILSEYKDINTAIAYIALDKNNSALEILERLEKSPSVSYMLAILYARIGKDREALESFIHACSQDRSFINRANLDPEIYSLTQRYQLNLNNYEHEF